MKLTGTDRQTDRQKDQADVLTKRGALGNLGYVRLAILTLMAGIKTLLHVHLKNGTLGNLG